MLYGCVCCYVRKNATVSSITERRDMGMYEVPVSFLDRDYVS